MVDGAYFHIWKYKLHTRPESHVEQITRTLNAILFPPIVYLLLYRDSAGLLLWLAAAHVAIESWAAEAARDVDVDPRAVTRRALYDA